MFVCVYALKRKLSFMSRYRPSLESSLRLTTAFMYAKILLHCFAERRVNHSNPFSFFPLHSLQPNMDQPPIPTPNPNLLNSDYTAQIAVRKQIQANHASQLSTLSVASSISESLEDKITACELEKDFLPHGRIICLPVFEGYYSL